MWTERHTVWKQYERLSVEAGDDASRTVTGVCEQTREDCQGSDKADGALENGSSSARKKKTKTGAATEEFATSLTFCQNKKLYD